MAARWRLTAPHYLNVAGNTWEYKEVDRSTGKQVKKVFEVPTLLEPDQPSDWNYSVRDTTGQIVNGEIVVAWAESADHPRDIIFTGEPTPDMFPLNAEAEKVSASFQEKWKHPIDSLAPNYTEHLLDGLQKQMSETVNKPAQIEGLTEILAAMTAMMKQNQELLQALAAPTIEKRRA